LVRAVVGVVLVVQEGEVRGTLVVDHAAVGRVHALLVLLYAHLRHTGEAIHLQGVESRVICPYMVLRDPIREALRLHSDRVAAVVP